MERDLDVRTAEAVAVHFELAGLGSRFLALAVDLALQAVVILAALFLLLIFGALHAVHPPVRSASQVVKEGYAVVIALGSIAAFVLFFGYFIGFELWWNGQSPGKRLLGLRVMRDGGFPVDAGAAVIRNLVRVVEAALGFYVVSAFVTLLSPQNKRLGDYAAGTVVVRESAIALPTLEMLAPREADASGELGRDDRALIERYLARRESLDPGAAHTIATAIASRIRPKLRASFHYLDDESLLEHIARSRG